MTDIELSNIEKVKAIISDCSYKPNWRIKAHEHTMPNKEWFIVDIVVDGLENSYRPGELLGRPLHLTVFTPLKWTLYMPEEREVMYWIRSLIDDLEHHERDEWFKYKGKRVVNPHLVWNTGNI